MAAVASSSRVLLRAVKQPPATQRALLSLLAAPAAQSTSAQRADVAAWRQWQSEARRSVHRDDRSGPRSSFLLTARLSQGGRLSAWHRSYATRAFAEAVPNGAHLRGNHTASADGRNNAKQRAEEAKEEEEADPDEPPKKAGIREKLRFLMRRYGWWALGVYLLASLADFSLVFAAIHMLGADHIRGLEDQLRRKLGMGERKTDDLEVAAWPVPIPAAVEGTASQIAHGGVASNQQAAREALAKRGNVAEAVAGSAQSETPAQGAASQASSSKDSKSSSSTLWTEAVLAYTIHKTLLLPFRVGVTAAITPSFVKYLVRHGWARNNAAVHQAAARAKALKAEKASRKVAGKSAGGAAAAKSSSEAEP